MFSWIHVPQMPEWRFYMKVLGLFPACRKVLPRSSFGVCWWYGYGVWHASVWFLNQAWLFGYCARQCCGTDLVYGLGLSTPRQQTRSVLWHCVIQLVWLHEGLKIWPRGVVEIGASTTRFSKPLWAPHTILPACKGTRGQAPIWHMGELGQKGPVQCVGASGWG